MKHQHIIIRWFSPRNLKAHLVFWGGAILVGAVASIVAIVADIAQREFVELINLNQYYSLFITPLGFGVCAFFARTMFLGSQGSGIPQVIASSQIIKTHPYISEKLVSLKIITGKTLLLFIGLLSGASIGREGPTVQIGAGIMLMCGRLGKFQNESVLLLAGGAAGVAAAFNTPLAGIIFAIEELGRSFEQKTSGMVLISVTLAGLTSTAILGDYIYFGHVQTLGLQKYDYVSAVICGVCGGLLGGLFTQLLLWGLKLSHHVFSTRSLIYPILFAMLCGLIISLLALSSHCFIYGTGYAQVKSLLDNQDNPSLIFGPLKFLSTLISGLSGIPGGIFAPSLSIGAGMGADLYQLFHSSPLTTMTLLGMVGFFSGVVQSPLTAFVIVLEMSDDHQIIIPLMIASILAYGVSRLISEKSLYHTLAQRFIKQYKMKTSVFNA